ncbi:hypothetical protein D3C86_1870670 [compost metagenome]
MLQKTIADILDVQRTFFHVLIIDEIKHADEFINNFFDRDFCGFVLQLDNALNLIHENRIFQNGQMCIENIGLLLPYHFFDLLFD